MKQSQPRIHHTEPFVVAAQVLTLLADNLAQPLLDFRIIHIVVVDPFLVPGIVGRIDIDALDSPLVFGKQGFQRFEVVAVNDFITAICRSRVSRIIYPEPIFVLQHPIWHLLMVIDNFLLSYPSQCRHMLFFFRNFFCYNVQTFLYGYILLVVQYKAFLNTLYGCNQLVFDF